MVSVTIVTWNSAQHIERCLFSALRQDYRDLEIVIVDNASTDNTRTLLRNFEPRCQVIYNQENTGFAAAQNQAIRCARGEWILCLNPDVVLSREFVSQLVAVGKAHPEAGTVCGKLLRWNPEAEPHETNLLDSTGILFTRNLRHLDRGADEIDAGQYNRPQYVFGGTGAAALYRRDFIDDVSVEGEFFDEEFFAYREDADLAWRAQVMGWRCFYMPAAIAWHVRRVTPERRGQLPLLINWHSAKNRFLMRGKNASGWLCRRLFWPVLWRDLMVVGYALLRDWRLLSALRYVWQTRENIRRKRAAIQSRRRVDDRDLLSWFTESHGPEEVTL